MQSLLPPTILVIDSDLVSRTAISNILERSGFIVISKNNSDDALKLFNSQSTKPHLVLVQSKLEGLSGIEVCTLIKTKQASGDIPVLIVADHSDSLDDLMDLENGFDDYIPSHYSASDILSKVNHALNKHKPNLRKKILSYGNISINLMSYKVTKNKREVHLGPTEFKILKCFIEDPKKIFSREDIMEYVWGKSKNVEPRTIDVHINRLRSALSEPGQRAHSIKTIRSSGYCLESSETA